MFVTKIPLSGNSATTHEVLATAVTAVLKQTADFNTSNKLLKVSAPGYRHTCEELRELVNHNSVLFLSVVLLVLLWDHGQIHGPVSAGGQPHKGLNMKSFFFVFPVVLRSDTAGPCQNMSRVTASKSDVAAVPHLSIESHESQCSAVNFPAHTGLCTHLQNNNNNTQMKRFLVHSYTLHIDI